MSSYFCLVKVDGKQFGQFNHIIKHSAVNPMLSVVLNMCKKSRTFDTYFKRNKAIKKNLSDRVSIPGPLDGCFS